MAKRTSKRRGVPVLLHYKAGKVCCTVGGREVCLDWKPGGSKASLTAEVAALATASLTGWERAVIMVVVKAAVAAFLSWWQNRGPGSKPKSNAWSGRRRKPSARDVARTLRQSKRKRYGWQS